MSRVLSECVTNECTAVTVPGTGRCLLHLDASGRHEALAALAPGAEVDFRGVRFTEELWLSLTDAVGARFGTARFDTAHFPAGVRCEGLRFDGPAYFEGTSFEGEARFDGAEFHRYAGFDATCFAGTAFFREARFHGEVRFVTTRFAADACFDGVSCASVARFSETRFDGTGRFTAARFSDRTDFSEAWFRRRSDLSADFSQACFTGVASFHGVRFRSRAVFADTRFESEWRGPIVCAGELWLRGAVFKVPFRIGIAAGRLDMNRVRCESTAAFHLRYTAVSLRDAVLVEPVTVSYEATPFTAGPRQLEQEMPREEGSVAVRLLRLSGVNAAHLVLTDVDLSHCEFSGAYNLDQIGLSGRCGYGTPPPGLRRGDAWFPVRWWSRRRVVVEEQHWRALPGGSRTATDTDGWITGLGHPDPAQSPTADDVAIVYRQLRKALEDTKNEPGAADFYYGEMEMRRHNKETPTGERLLLHAYWLLSGYGLRASRAVGALLCAMGVTILLIMLWGLPAAPPSPRMTGQLPTGGGELVLSPDTTRKSYPAEIKHRWSNDRLERAGRVVVNSVVFRSSGQDLTQQGLWIEMGSRLGEPVLLGLAVLAARGRVKR
ncbi:pentapeptide repeat-containing protein [Streptomyces sp. NPDC050704]|uniref:pentapeptide repeat-containing protein n=1 Tax=Streptomyces sp. NPDC050704 TaxID=3157219 RepID=UPI0034298718